MPHGAAATRLNPCATPHLLRPLSSLDGSGFPLQQSRSLDAGAKRQASLATKRSALKQVFLEAAARRQISSATVMKGPSRSGAIQRRRPNAKPPSPPAWSLTLRRKGRGARTFAPPCAAALARLRLSLASSRVAAIAAGMVICGPPRRPLHFVDEIGASRRRRDQRRALPHPRPRSWRAP